MKRPAPHAAPAPPRPRRAALAARARPAFASLALLALLACGAADGIERTLIQNKGSDTLLNVAQAWAEAYSSVDASVAVAVTGGGSGTGVSAMINGTVDIANSSRRMRDTEREAARKNGVEPVEFVVGYDALAIYLHEDNPIERITMEQIRAVYREGGHAENWPDLGVSVPGCSSGEIVRVSRQNNSGTYAYFKAAVLGEDAEFKLGSRDMHGSKDVVELVENTPCAIGYSGLAYATEHVGMPCVVSDAGKSAAVDDDACVAPTVASAVNGSYPIARPLFMYSAGRPRGPVKEYLDWILSDEGQCLILQRGYAPVREVACT